MKNYQNVKEFEEYYLKNLDAPDVEVIDLDLEEHIIEFFKRAAEKNDVSLETMLVYTIIQSANETLNNNILEP